MQSSKGKGEREGEVEGEREGEKERKRESAIERGNGAYQYNIVHVVFLFFFLLFRGWLIDCH